jgi:hypothetical protein
MNKIEAAVQRYAASASLQHDGVELVAVNDPVGARLNRAVKQVRVSVREDRGGRRRTGAPGRRDSGSRQPRTRVPPLGGRHAGTDYWARLTALVSALIDASTIFASIPTPQSVVPSTSHST